jgi:hypothetical protein
MWCNIIHINCRCFVYHITHNRHSYIMSMIYWSRLSTSSTIRAIYGRMNKNISSNMSKFWIWNQIWLWNCSRRWITNTSAFPFRKWRLCLWHLTIWKLEINMLLQRWRSSSRTIIWCIPHSSFCVLFLYLFKRWSQNSRLGNAI